MQRINKRQARELYTQNKDVYICPVKCRIDGAWTGASCLPKGMDFDTIVNSYEYYNCNYTLGYYAAFYVKTLC